jgi:LysM repeat protein
MQTSSNAPRVLAVLALLAAVIALLVVISDSLSGDSGSHPNTTRVEARPHEGGGKAGKAPAFYVVQSGDTLSSIAARTGVSVEKLQLLNPDVDPQILVSGQKLKLR